MCPSYFNHTLFSSNWIEFGLFFNCGKIHDINFTILIVSQCTAFTLPSSQYTIHLSNFFHHPRLKLYILNNNFHLSPLPNPWHFHSTFCLCSLAPLGTLYKWNHTYLSFCDWLILLSVMSSGFMHVVAHVRISFLFKAE